MLMRLIFVVAMSLSLAGCLLWNKATINGTGFSTTQAETRLLYSKKVSSSRPGTIIANEMVCLEPSPDVAKASQKAMELVLNSGGKGKGQISASSAEAVASLVERTATIQLLRDQMFRACEAYSNGAMTATSYSLLMARNNKAMITLMLGETAAGAFGRQGVALGGKSSAEGELRTDGSQDDVEAALDKLVSIDAEVAVATEEKNKAQAAYDEIKDNEEEDQQAAKEELKKALAEKDKNLNELNAKKANALKLVQFSHDQTSKSAAESVTVQGFGALNGTVSTQAIRALTQMQEIYLKDSIADEVISACLVEMGFTVGQGFADDFNKPILDKIKTLTDEIAKAQNEETKDKAASNIESLYNSLSRKSALTEYCIVNLPDMVKQAEIFRQSNAKRYYKYKTDALGSEAVVACASINNQQAKNACLRQVGISIPEERKKVDVRFFPKLNELNKLIEKLGELKLSLVKANESLADVAPKITSQEVSDCTKVSEANKRAKCELLAKSNDAFITSKIDEIRNGKQSFPAIKPLSELETEILNFTQEAAKQYQSSNGEFSEDNYKLWKDKYDELNKKLQRYMERFSALEKKLNSTLLIMKTSM